MKRLLTLSILLLSAFAFGATTTPVQLLNPTGSTAGQAILSTGPTSAPAWGTVTLSGVSGTLAISNGGTGTTTLTAHGVLIGEGTSAVATVGPGSNGQMLLGVTSADPYWGNNPAISGGTVDNSPIGNTTASSGKFTTLSATGAVSGAGFTSLLSPYATLASPTFTGTVTIPTGASITKPNIIGTATNDNASAGSVGEYATANTSATSLTTNTAANCTSVSLTAGDWDVQAVVGFTPTGTTAISRLQTGVSTTSATLGILGTVGSQTFINTGTVTNTYMQIPSPVVRVSLSATTTVYAIGHAIFSASTLTCDGFIRARRVR